MLCEVIAIYKNPKYRIIKYNDEYLMVNIINNWLVLFIPLLNWLTPKRYIKISQEELENLNTFKPAKNNAFWPALGSSVLFSVTFRKYMPLFNVRLEKTIVIAIFFVLFLGILLFYLNLNRRLALSVFTMNKVKSNMTSIDINKPSIASKSATKGSLLYHHSLMNLIIFYLILVLIVDLLIVD